MCVSKIAIENSEIGYCCNFEAEPELPVSQLCCDYGGRDLLSKPQFPTDWCCYY